MTGAALAVTFLTTGLARAGAETQLVRIARELLARGHRIEVICLGNRGSLSGDLEQSGIVVTHLGIHSARPNPLKLLRLVRLLRTTRPQVLVCFMVHANIAGRVAGRIARVRTIITSIRNEHFGGRVRETLERWTEPLGQLVTTNSETVAKSLLHRGIASEDRLEVIPNCLEPAEPVEPEHEARLREYLGARPSDFLWLAVGHLEPQKDVPRLIEAFAAVLEVRPDARLAIAGEGSLAGVLEREIHDRELSDRVTLLGLRSDVPALLGAADGYVLSSAWESSPNSLLEAALAGVPAIATDVGGVREIVSNGENGFLVPPRDTAALSGAMLRMMAMPLSDRERMGNSRRAELLHRSSVSRVVDLWESAFRKALAP